MTAATVTLLLGTVILLPSTLLGDTLPPMLAEVTQAGRAFSIRELRVRRGATIRFRNADSFLHQVYVDASPFRFTSAEQPPGATLDKVFPVQGVFDVRCEIHPKMTLSVTVD